MPKGVYHEAILNLLKWEHNMEYTAIFQIGEKGKKSKFKVSAPCTQEALEEAKKHVPPGYRVVDVVPNSSRTNERVLRQVC